MRAQFIRGLDAGKGIDTGRVILSLQGDAIRNMTGKSNGIVHSGNSVTDGVFSPGLTGTGVNLVLGGSNVENLFFDASLQVPTALENRVKNIAFYYIVRAA